MEQLTNISASNFTLLSIYLIFILAIAFLVRLYFVTKNSKQTPLIVLQKKLSNGEIDTNEYQKQIRQLQKEEDLKMKHFFLTRI